MRWTALWAILAGCALSGCATKLQKASTEPLVAEIQPELVRTPQGGLVLRASTNLPDGTHLRAFTSEVPAIRGCSVVKHLCEFAPWDADSLTQNYEALNITIEAEFGEDEQPEPVVRVVGFLGANLRGPLAVTPASQAEPIKLKLTRKVAVGGS